MILLRIITGFVLLYVNYVILYAGIKAGDAAVFIGFIIALVFNVIVAPFWGLVIHSKKGTSDDRPAGKRTANNGDKTSAAPKSRPRTIRCPNCGAEATVHGDQWECGWCGDYGRFIN